MRRLGWPVISIGNLSAGGSGKTPLTIALARGLTARGWLVDVLSRGYGRQGVQAVRVDGNGSAEEFGDEPLLIARSAAVPVYVAGQRYEAGRLAESAVGLDAGTPGAARPSGQRASFPGGGGDPRVHLLDDGFQHRQLYRDVDILLLSRTDWNDRLLPAGNLREALRAAMRSSVVAIPSDDPAFEEQLRDWGWKGPVWRLKRRMEVPAEWHRGNGPVVAFCGIARPQQFFAGLEAAGVRLAAAIAYPDHHRFTALNLRSLLIAARSHGATALMTTEKDRVRLGPLAELLPADLPLFTVPLRVEIEDAAAALDWLANRLQAVPVT